MDYELCLDFVDVIEGLKKFKIPRKLRQSEKAILAFDGRFCSIEALNVVIVAKATGTWPGIARFSASAIAALVKALEIADQIQDSFLAMSIVHLLVRGGDSDNSTTSFRRSKTSKTRPPPLSQPESQPNHRGKSR